MEEALIDILEHGRSYTLLVRDVDKFAESDHFMDSLTHGMVGDSALIKPVVQFVKHQMGKINDDCRVERMLERQGRTNDWYCRKMVMGYPRHLHDRGLNHSPKLIENRAANIDVAFMRRTKRESNLHHRRKYVDRTKIRAKDRTHDKQRESLGEAATEENLQQSVVTSYRKRRRPRAADSSSSKRWLPGSAGSQQISFG